MIRTAILACALVAVPSAALAQVQSSTPGQVRILQAPAAPTDGPPADYISGMAPEYNGWIYQVTNRASPTEPLPLELYRGEGYPATIMVCSTLPVRLLLRGEDHTGVGDNRCNTVTTDVLRISSSFTTPVKFRYRILAVHRAAD